MARDGYGNLARDPVTPKRGILVILRRGLDTLHRQEKKLSGFRKSIADIEKALLKMEHEADRLVALRRIEDFKGRIERLSERRDFTHERVILVIREAEARSLDSWSVARSCGRESVVTLLTLARQVSACITVRRTSGARASSANMATLGRDDAFKLLYGLAEKSTPGLIYTKVRFCQMDEDDASGRLHIAVMRAAQSWDWRKAQFATLAFGKTRRELQTRTQVEQPILSRVLPTGQHVVARSLSMSKEEGERVFEAGAVSATNVGSHVVLRGTTASAEASERASASEDVATALARLPDADRHLAAMLWLEEGKVSEVAASLGVSLSTVRSRQAKLAEYLRSVLSVYEPEEAK